MLWPFVSRERYQEQANEIGRLRAEIAECHTEIKRLTNWIVWRTGGGVALDASLLPEAYRPKPPVPAKAEDAKETNHSPARRAPGQARHDIAEWEVKRQRDYEKVAVAPSAQIALVGRLEEAVAEGERAAGGK